MNLIFYSPLNNGLLWVTNKPLGCSRANSPLAVVSQSATYCLSETLSFFREAEASQCLQMSCKINKISYFMAFHRQL